MFKGVFICSSPLLRLTVFSLLFVAPLGDCIWAEAAAGERPQAPLLGCSRDHAVGQAPPAVVQDTASWKLRKQLMGQFAQGNVPGSAVIAVQGQEVIFEMYQGCASTLPNELQPVNDESIFLLASISKTLTAVTFLHLVDRLHELRPKDLKPGQRDLFGRFCLGRPVDEFLECHIENFLDFKIYNPNDRDQEYPIRFLDLLEHTSGIIDSELQLDCVYTLDADSTSTMGEFIKKYLISPAQNEATGQKYHREGRNDLLCFDISAEGWWTGRYPLPVYNREQNFGIPGRFSYSNAGYTLLGYSLERVLEEVCPILRRPPRGKEGKGLFAECRKARAGKGVPGPTYPMWKYSREVLLKPLGIEEQGQHAGAWLFSQLDPGGVCTQGELSCKMVRGAGNLPYYSFPGYANGGFRTTARALSRYLRMLMNNGTWIDPKRGPLRILREDTARRITDFSGRDMPWQTQTSLGFALYTSFVDDSDTPKFSRLVIGHTGGEHGVATMMFWLPVPSAPEKSLGVLILTNGNNLVPEVFFKALTEVFDNFQERTVPSG